MNIRKLQLSLVLIFILSAAVFGTELNPVAFGAVPDDNQDDTIALQATVDAVVQKGGGTIVLPGGKLNINGTIRIVPSQYFGGELRVKGTRGAFLEISAGVGGFVFYAGNLNVLSFEDVVFIGKNVPQGDPAFFDARYVIFSTYIQHTNIIRCQFFGLATPSDGAVVYLGNTDGKIVDSQFDGSHGQYPNGSVILAENSRGLTVSRSTFIDYANYIGGYVSKTTAFTGNWIAVRGGLPLGGNGVRRIVVEDSRFDEGAAAAVSISDVTWAFLSGNSVNVNSTSEGKGFYLKNIEHVKIEHSWFGYASVARPALDLVNVRTVEVTSLKLGGAIYFARKENVTNFVVKFCDQCVRGGSTLKPN